MVCMARRPACETLPHARRLPVAWCGCAGARSRQPAFASSARFVRGQLLRRAFGRHRPHDPRWLGARTVAGDPSSTACRPAGARRAGRIAAARGCGWATAAAGGPPLQSAVTIDCTAGLPGLVGDQMPSVGLRATDGYLLNLRTLRDQVALDRRLLRRTLAAGRAASRGRRCWPGALAEAQPRLQRAGIGLIAVTTDSEAQQAAYVEGAEASLPAVLRRATHRRRDAGHPDPQRAGQRQRRADGLRARSTATILDVVPRGRATGAGGAPARGHQPADLGIRPPMLAVRSHRAGEPLRMEHVHPGADRGPRCGSRRRAAACAIPTCTSHGQIGCG